MPNPKDSLKERLTKYRQIKISVIGRKSGRTISIPVWFVLEAEKLYLLPVQGSNTQWYKNVLQNPSIRIDARGVGEEFRAVPLTDTKAVKSVIEQFRQKYGVKDVKKYYSKFDVAVVTSHTLTWPYVPPARICSRLRSRRRRLLLLRPHPDHHRHVPRINHIPASGEEVGIHRHGRSIEAKPRSHDPGVRERSHNRA